MPASCGVLPTASTIVTETNGPPLLRELGEFLDESVRSGHGSEGSQGAGESTGVGVGAMPI